MEVLGAPWGVLGPSWPQESPKSPQDLQKEVRGSPWDPPLGGQNRHKIAKKRPKEVRKTFAKALVTHLVSELQFLSEPTSPRDRPGHHKCSKTTREVFKNELGPNCAEMRPRRALETLLGEVLGPCWAPKGTLERPKAPKSAKKNESGK